MGFYYEIDDLTTLRAIKQAIFQSIFDYQYEDVYFTLGTSAHKVGKSYTFVYHRCESRKIEVPICKVESIIRDNKWNKLDTNTNTYSNKEILPIFRALFKNDVARYDNSELDKDVVVKKCKHSDRYYVKYFNKSKNHIADYTIDLIKVHTIADRNRRRAKANA